MTQMLFAETGAIFLYNYVVVRFLFPARRHDQFIFCVKPKLTKIRPPSSNTCSRDIEIISLIGQHSIAVMFQISNKFFVFWYFKKIINEIPIAYSATFLCSFNGKIPGVRFKTFKNFHWFYFLHLGTICTLLV